MADWRNRISEHAEVNPKELVANPKNYKAHPDQQKKAMAGALGELGWLQEVTVNKRTGRIIDGHMRVALAIKNNKPTVPVAYVDLSEEEETVAISTLDPIGGLAQIEAEKYSPLLENALALSTDDALKELLAEQQDQYAEVVLPPEPTNAYYRHNSWEDYKERRWGSETLATPEPQPEIAPEVNMSTPAPAQPEAEASGNGEAPESKHTVLPDAGTRHHVVAAPEMRANTPAPAEQKMWNKMNLIQLYVSPEVYDELIPMLRVLAKRFTTTNVTDTIVEAIRYAGSAVQQGEERKDA